MFDRKCLQAEVDRYNSIPGRLKDGYTDKEGRFVPGDGIDCPKCLNRGHVRVVMDDGSGPRVCVQWCSCQTARAAVRRLQESGLGKSVDNYSFSRFEASEPWQIKMLDTAKRYLKQGIKDRAWLYVGGQSGAGKTHVCMAVASELVKTYDLRYVIWPQVAQRLGASKMGVNDEYESELHRLQSVDVLYIDDFFKPVFRANGAEAMATATDVRVAYDILNYRYNMELPTIITSEWFSGELAEIDGALAGRIAERSGPYKLDIARDKARNHRLVCKPI